MNHHTRAVRLRKRRSATMIIIGWGKLVQVVCWKECALSIVLRDPNNKAYSW